jgi:hypothetical protein
MGPENSDGFEGLVRLRGLLLHRHFYGGLEGFHWESGQGIGRPGEMRRGKGERWNGLQKFQFIYYLYIEDVHIAWNWYSDEFPSCWT